LTAKTITRSVAEDTLAALRDNRLEIRTITLTAKEKICFKESPVCTPEICEYANGHFDRVNDALMDMLQSEQEFTREKIQRHCRSYKVCPFEFSLDLTLWSDVIICDYNYVFNPNVYLKRFFIGSGGDYTFLIDEAHNLVDRSREMFSAELYKKPFLNLKKRLKDKNKNMAREIGKVNSYLLEMKKLCGDNNYYMTKELPEDLCNILKEFASVSEEYLIKSERNEVYEDYLNLYFDVLKFIKVLEFFDERYVLYVEKVKGEVKIKLFCLDPSHLLSEALKRGRSSVFFFGDVNAHGLFSSTIGEK